MLLRARCLGPSRHLSSETGLPEQKPKVPAPRAHSHKITGFTCWLRGYVFLTHISIKHDKCNKKHLWEPPDITPTVCTTACRRFSPGRCHAAGRSGWEPKAQESREGTRHMKDSWEDRSKLPSVVWVKAP